jgi:hypothetical protein
LAALDLSIDLTESGFRQRRAYFHQDERPRKAAVEERGAMALDAPATGATSPDGIVDRSIPAPSADASRATAVPTGQ